jgi:type VI secretion system secreted protein Hcp
VTHYLKLDGIDGSVTTSGFEKWFEIESAHFGTARHIGSSRAGAGDRESSEVNVSELTLTKIWDSASPKLFNESVAGKGDKMAKLHLTSTVGGKPEPYLKIELKNCFVSAYSVSSRGADKPSETLTLNFTYITITHTERDEKGGGTPSSTSFDLKLGTKG